MENGCSSRSGLQTENAVLYCRNVYIDDGFVGRLLKMHNKNNLHDNIFLIQGNFETAEQERVMYN